MFSPHLYDHKFDIDDLIAAMLAGEGSYLETVTGKLSATPPQADAKHSFYLDPLPLTWLAELESHDEHFRLTDTEQAQLASLIQAAKSLEEIKPTVFGSAVLGGWLRERVKEEALQWLADNNLIPPSMRHINGVPRARRSVAKTAERSEGNPKPASSGAPSQVKKVTIEPA